MKKIQLHIDRLNGSYLIKLQHPVLAQVKSFKRINVNEIREKIIVKVNRIRKLTLDINGFGGEMHANLIEIGQLVRELIGNECIDDIRELKKEFDNLLLLIDDPIVPWELMIIDDEILCLNNSIGRILIGSVIQTDYKHIQMDKLLILFIGDPVDDLPATRIEIDNIIKELKPAIDKGYIETIRLEGHDANTTNILNLLKNRKINIIHYSGHAFFNDEIPENSGLILTDKVITANDLSKAVNYFPDVIFVNACESAQTLSNYDNVSGIAEGFIRSGVKWFIGSLWPIDDKEASSFAFSFYHNLIQEKSIGECIQSAKNELFNAKSIYGWASFVLFGDPSEKLGIFNDEFKNNIERTVIPTVEEPFKLRLRKDISLLKSISFKIDQNTIPMGVEDSILNDIQENEFNIILGPAGIGKTNCKHLISQNDRDFHFVEIDKNFLKGIKNSEALLKIRKELELLSEVHKYLILVFDEEHYSSDMNVINLFELVGLLFPSGQPTQIKPNLRIVLFLRTKSFKKIWHSGKVPAHWKIHQIWLRGIKLNENSINNFFSIHDLSKDNFTIAAYELLKNKISSNGWIYPIFADKLMLFLEKNYKDKFTTEDIEKIHISDEIISSIRNLVYRIRSSEAQQIWNCIVQINNTFELNPPFWLIKKTIKMMNIDIPNIKEVLAELVNEKLLIEEKNEIFSNLYYFSHDIYYDIVTNKIYDDEFILELTESIEEELNKNLSKIQTIKNPKKLNLYLNVILQHFYFLSVNPYGSLAEYIDDVLDYFKKLDVETLAPIIPYFELLVLDFYSRNLLDPVSKLYLYIGEYHERKDNLDNATDFYNIGCHILENQGKDSSEYRIKNGYIYDKLIPNLNLNEFDSQVKVELAAWQWKASKQYEKGIQIRKLLVDLFLKINKPWAAAEYQWLAEVATLNKQYENAINYYYEAINILKHDEKHIFNIIWFITEISKLLTKLNRNDELTKLETNLAELKNVISKFNKPNTKKIVIISGIGDLYVANQIKYKLMNEISTNVVIKQEVPPENYDILILFGSPLTPKIGHIIFNYMDREIINEMLSSDGGYWIKKPVKENNPLIISIAGYTMFNTRIAAEKFITTENFNRLMNNS
ncbi:MAG: CHAT domain-containing protein [Candidatus Helarchaeota archaeon]